MSPAFAKSQEHSEFAGTGLVILVDAKIIGPEQLVSAPFGGCSQRSFLQACEHDGPSGTDFAGRRG